VVARAEAEKTSACSATFWAERRTCLSCSILNPK
jgi:hypothetical protein